jgi:hypothetical protein
LETAARLNRQAINIHTPAAIISMISLYFIEISYRGTSFPVTLLERPPVLIPLKGSFIRVSLNQQTYSNNAPCGPAQQSSMLLLNSGAGETKPQQT